ncbi:hypothetical protein RDWZM_004183, partial [Blomia tropicalis]
AIVIHEMKCVPKQCSEERERERDKRGGLLASSEMIKRRKSRCSRSVDRQAVDDDDPML